MASHFEYIARAKADKIVELNCGCNIELWKVLTVTALQLKDKLPVQCPFHETEHDFSKCPLFHDWARQFFDYMDSTEGRKIYPDFFLNKK